MLLLYGTAIYCVISVKQAIGEIYRVLRPGGLLSVSLTMSPCSGTCIHIHDREVYRECIHIHDREGEKERERERNREILRELKREMKKERTRENKWEKERERERQRERESTFHHLSCLVTP